MQRNGQEREQRESLGCCLMVGLIIGSLLLGNAIKAVRSDDRVVSVKGLCEQVVKADKVICPFAYKVGGDNLQQLYASIEQKNHIRVKSKKPSWLWKWKKNIPKTKLLLTI